jgi:SAM-dependent methyltransferase
MSEWFEEEGFWIDTYPVLFSEERFKIAPEQIEKALSLAKVEGNSVLDLCCGPGRHSIELAKRGFAVTGVDRTPFLLDKAKASAAEHKFDIEFVLSDMRDFIRPDAFDLVLNMFTSFGYFDNKGEDLKVLRNIYESLRQGGVLLIDVFGKEAMARMIQPVTIMEVADTMIVERHEIFDDWRRIRNEWVVIKGESAKRLRFHHTVYSGQELKSLFEQAGFDDVKLFGDLEGNSYGLNATRLIVVGRKSS